MNLADILYVFNWWLTVFIIGSFFLPFTNILFKNFNDKGYIFSKSIGLAVLTYTIFLLGTFHLVPFNRIYSIGILVLFFLINYLVLKRQTSIFYLLRQKWKICVFEELLFFSALLFWSFIKAYQPDIHGLEKFMDYGFLNSILRSNYFPARDMWFTPFSINYYYFGHLITAVITKVSNIPSFITFNLMLSTIFAFTFTSSFSIGLNLYQSYKETITFKAVLSGLFTGLLITVSGNLHTIYIFFLPYQTSTPVPFWKLPLALSTIPNSYWYPNATRFIFNTIHEFPLYSFVVSDLHGHVLDIPFVLLTIAFLFSLLKKYYSSNYTRFICTSIPIKVQFYDLFFLSFILAILYMTNSSDGVIYILLTFLIVTLLYVKSFKKYSLMQTSMGIIFVIFLLGLFFKLISLPFSYFFDAFISGIGVLCAPAFLVTIHRLGPFLFEADHCQSSPLWQLFILYGFFYFWVFSFLIMIIVKKNTRDTSKDISTIFTLALILLSTLLIIVPEFIYAKDIYPAHYRANTMFKLVYQSFMMLSLCCGYIITRNISYVKNLTSSSISILKKYALCYYLIIGFSLTSLVLAYPYYAVNSYFGGLKKYYGLNGISYLQQLYPTDYAAIIWLNKYVKGHPVILEAQGDSYTDYARISANTGLPTVLGWTVHEWLWRKTYDVPAPRITDVKTLYETSDKHIAKQLIQKYNISYIFIGDLEKQKYPAMNDEKFLDLGKLMYTNGTTKIYKIK